MQRNDRRSLVGFILLLAGLILLLDRWQPDFLGWNTLLVALGVALIVAGLRRDRGAILPGTFLFLLGVLLLIKEQHLIYIPWWQTFPLIVLALGVSFVVLYLFDPQRKGVLIPGVLLIAGSLIYLKFPYILEEIFDWLKRWWPLLLVIVGLRLIWSSTRAPKKDAG